MEELVTDMLVAEMALQCCSIKFIYKAEQPYGAKGSGGQQMLD